MIRTNQACDPAIHLAATRLARKCVAIIESLLRQETYAVACEEFSLVIRETPETIKSAKDQ